MNFSKYIVLPITMFILGLILGIILYSSYLNTKVIPSYSTTLSNKSTTAATIPTSPNQYNTVYTTIETNTLTITKILSI